MSSRNGRRSGRSKRVRVASRSLRVAETEPPYFTKRELEVIEWIAAGKRNREIGQILGCSARTVQKHVQHILEKLNLETRTAVAVWRYERRLKNAETPDRHRK